MMNEDQVAAAGEALFAAERDRSQTRLISAAYPGMDMDDAYAVQAAFVRRKLAAGGVVRGWKIGLTSKAMQYALNIDIPDSGILFADMFFDHGGTVPAGRFIEPRIEAEIAFIMKTDLAGGEVTPADVIAATDHVAPALEILDTRIYRADPDTGAQRSVLDTISDNAANAGIVLGDSTHAIDQTDLRWVGAIVARNDEVEETGLGAGVLNDPVLSMAWLVHRLARYGDGLRAGDVVLSGSFIRPIEARHGDSFLADYGPFGTVRVKFE
ncbi:MAG: 2-oxo-hepta-3-ene-1,7-dioic acid hydratase [Rhodobiaceae bacterium]